MNKPTNSTTDERPKHPKRFCMIDPLAIDRKLLYSVDGKPRIGLILEAERGADGLFSVSQASPAKLREKGLKGKVVGNWHVLGRKWDSKDGKAAAEKKGGSAEPMTR